MHLTGYEPIAHQLLVVALPGGLLTGMTPRGAPPGPSNQLQRSGVALSCGRRVRRFLRLSYLPPHAVPEQQSKTNVQWTCEVDFAYDGVRFGV